MSEVSGWWVVLGASVFLLEVIVPWVRRRFGEGSFSVCRKVVMGRSSSYLVVREFRIRNTRERVGWFYLDATLLPGDIILMDGLFGQVLRKTKDELKDLPGVRVSSEEVRVGVERGHILNTTVLAQVSELLRLMGVKDTRKKPRASNFESIDLYTASVSSLLFALTGEGRPEPDEPEAQQEGRPEPDETEPSRLTYRLERLTRDLAAQEIRFQQEGRPEPDEPDPSRLTLDELSRLTLDELSESLSPSPESPSPRSAYERLADEDDSV